MTFDRMTDLDLSDKRVLIREDLNVPLDNGKIVNDARIRAVLPTIRQARENAAQVILMSHLGRPEEGVPISKQPEFSLCAVAEHLETLLECQVELIEDYLADPGKVRDSSADVVLLENVRVNKGEKANDPDLASQYAALCDIFVMDAFGTAHRAQASTHGVAEAAERACAGPLLADELDALERSLRDPKRPMLAIVGGSKVSTKLEVLRTMAEKVDQLIVGGGIANTFLLAQGVAIGKSLCEPDLVDTAKELMQKTSIPLPSDVIVAREISADAEAVVKGIGDIEADDMILDIGPETMKRFGSVIGEMQTILWNGPVGVFEHEQFAKGSEAVARAIAASAAYSLAGGGETVAAIEKFGVSADISYISTGGGAFLEYVEGAELPAVEVLKKKHKSG